MSNGEFDGDLIDAPRSAGFGLRNHNRLPFDPTPSSDRAHELDGIFNSGWYGERLLLDTERLHPRSRCSAEQARSDDRYRVGTETLRQYLPSGEIIPDTLQKIIPPDVLRGRISAFQCAVSPGNSSKSPVYSVITPFFRHRKYFESCARSVRDLFVRDLEEVGRARAEWIVVSDDPEYPDVRLWEMIPEEIRSQVQIISDGMSRGISTRLNEGIELSRSDWLMFLDCDDIVEANAFGVLDHYISVFPKCRYVSSGMVDIDENDEVIRYRRHEFSACESFHKGMLAGHLKAIRRDLFEDAGPYKAEFNGCQDYEFALRVIAREQILLIPEYLYRYRWHPKSQSVGSFEKQESTATRVRRTFLSSVCGSRSLLGHYSDRPMNTRGLCIIRTQGRRLNLLEETLRSVSSQSLSITSCLVVHGDARTYEEICRWAPTVSRDVIVLHAHDTNRRRGYPLNVALDYLRARSDEFGFFCFLDDDDILYPLFSARLYESLDWNSADVAICLANKRTPWEPPVLGFNPLPVASLVAANFVPIHSYIVRTEVLLQSGARFREDMHYLEDWDFLVALIGAGAVFVQLPEVLCEYRIIGDGNRPKKQDPEHYMDCRERVLARARAAARRKGIDYFLSNLAEFDFAQRPALLPPEVGQLLDAQKVFEKVATK